MTDFLFTFTTNHGFTSLAFRHIDDVSYRIDVVFFGFSGGFL